jgi:hypothetical protein
LLEFFCQPLFHFAQLKDTNIAHNVRKSGRWSQKLKNGLVPLFEWNKETADKVYISRELVPRLAPTILTQPHAVNRLLDPAVGIPLTIAFRTHCL